jgi:hypothetical protein
MLFCVIVPLFAKNAAYLIEVTRAGRLVVSEEVPLIF